MREQKLAFHENLKLCSVGSEKSSFRTVKVSVHWYPVMQIS